MSYATKEVSVQDGSPVLLFLFVQGNSEWRYTNAPATVSRVGQSWTPGVVVPTKFGQSGEMPKESVTFKVPIDYSLAATFLGYSPDAVTSVTVFRAHLGETDYNTYWKGRVDSTSASGNFLSIQCEPLSNSMGQLGLRPVYQRSCPHAFITPGSKCRLRAEDFAQAGTVTAVNSTGSVITVTEASGMNNLLGGTFMAPDGTIRTITAHSGTTVTLMRGIKSLLAEMVAHPGGFAVTLYRGCDKSFTTCESLSNLGNFGGWAGTPDINPVGGNNIFA
jgi:hypothetical protein